MAQIDIDYAGRSYTVPSTKEDRDVLKELGVYAAQGRIEVLTLDGDGFALSLVVGPTISIAVSYDTPTDAAISAGFDRSDSPGFGGRIAVDHCHTFTPPPTNATTASTPTIHQMRYSRMAPTMTVARNRPSVRFMAHLQEDGVFFELFPCPVVF